MAINRKGMRPINVEGDVYLWRFGADIVSIFQEDPFGENRINYGYIPAIDDLGNEDRLGRTDTLQAPSITPAFIRRAILFAKKQNWNSGKLSLIYKYGKFAVIS